MNKFIPIALDDILSDEAGCSAMLTRVCTRSGRWRITGGGVVGDDFCALAEEVTPTVQPLSYRFARLGEPNVDEVSAAVSSRYYAGFSTLAFFTIADEIWGLFASPPTAEA